MNKNWRLSIAVIISWGITFFTVGSTSPGNAAYIICMANLVLFIFASSAKE